MKRTNYSELKDSILKTYLDMGAGYHEIDDINGRLNRMTENNWNATLDSVLALQRDGLLICQPYERRGVIAVCTYAYTLTPTGIEAATSDKGYRGWLAANRYAQQDSQRSIGTTGSPPQIVRVVKHFTRPTGGTQ